MSQLGVTEWKIYCGYDVSKGKASYFVFSHRENQKPSKKGGYKWHTTGWRKISWKKAVRSRHLKVNDLKRTLAGKIHVLFCNQELLFRVQQYIKMGKDKNIFCVSHWSRWEKTKQEAFLLIWVSKRLTLLKWGAARTRSNIFPAARISGKHRNTPRPHVIPGRIN